MFVCRAPSSATHDVCTTAEHVTTTSIMYLALCFLSTALGLTSTDPRPDDFATTVGAGTAAVGDAFGPQTNALVGSACRVGHYDTQSGAGTGAYATPITTAGATPVSLNDLTPADLAGVDVVFALNPNNGGIGGEWTSRLVS